MFDQLVDGYVSHGIETFWMDATEPQGANIGEWYPLWSIHMCKWTQKLGQIERVLMTCILIGVGTIA